MIIYTKVSERKCLHCLHLFPGHCYYCFSSELLPKIILVFRTYRVLKTSPSVSKAPGSLLLLDAFQHIKALTDTEPLNLPFSLPRAQAFGIFQLRGEVRGCCHFSEGLAFPCFPYSSPSLFFFNFLLFLLKFSSFTMLY